MGNTPTPLRKATRLEDLAQLAGVSVSTVSRALNDSPAINRRTKEHIWQLARQMDYPFRQSMPAGPIGADATIAIVVPQPQSRNEQRSDPFLIQLLDSISAAARERQCDVLISHIYPRNYEDLTSAMKTSRADGVIYIGQSYLRSEFNKLSQEDDRFVVWGAEFSDQEYCCVGSDNPEGGKRATSHLIRLDRQNIVFLGDTQAPEASQRYRGYLEAHAEHGLSVNEDMQIPAHFEVESAEAAIESLIASGKKFDGIVAASDMLALGAIRALQKNDRNVPEDVSVIGYDNIPFASLSSPALSTISQDTRKAGRMLVSKLLDTRGHVSRSERLPTNLIVRDTCGG
ncbi:LacI family DNA-binding transcriptional regulator [Hirschia maritima]|uniref:LacI family DNA-binding transcriptional regulator n=1 Tax=Hirschia maritima TaxID=1121961 RepID=UPI0003770A33|nr:LacI family DNA-binding transcriptional regulator [Hirschia maritima]